MLKVRAFFEPRTMTGHWTGPATTSRRPCRAPPALPPLRFPRSAAQRPLEVPSPHHSGGTRRLPGGGTKVRAPGARAPRPLARSHARPPDPQLGLAPRSWPWPSWTEAFSVPEEANLLRLFAFVFSDSSVGVQAEDGISINCKLDREKYLQFEQPLLSVRAEVPRNGKRIRMLRLDLLGIVNGASMGCYLVDEEGRRTRCLFPHSVIIEPTALNRTRISSGSTPEM